MIWTVLAPGPSLAEADLSRINGPTVGLNLAVLSPHRLDFWACQDPPQKFETVWGTMSKDQRIQAPVVWCMDRNTKAWNDLGFRVWPHPDAEPEFRSWAGLPVANKSCNMLGLTILASISRCIAHGATQVNVYGCDMAGTGYAYGADRRNRTLGSWNSRWVAEVGTFDNAVAEWAQRGVTVTRIPA